MGGALGSETLQNESNQDQGKCRKFLKLNTYLFIDRKMRRTIKSILHLYLF